MKKSYIKRKSKQQPEPSVSVDFSRGDLNGGEDFDLEYSPEFDIEPVEFGGEDFEFDETKRNNRFKKKRDFEYETANKPKKKKPITFEKPVITEPREISAGSFHDAKLFGKGGIAGGFGDEDENCVNGTVESVVYRNEDNGYTVCSVDCGGELLTVVGTMPFVGEGEVIRARGVWTTHPVYGKQLKIECFEKALPRDVNSIYKYLASGVISGIGPITATRIVEHFGTQTFDVIENNPEWLCEIKGITKKRADEISQSYTSQFGMRSVMLFFQEYFGLSISAKIYRRYGTAAVDLVRLNPYRLCTEISHVTFAMADEMAKSFGFSEICEERVCAGIIYVLSNAAYSGGHCRLPTEMLSSETAAMLRCGEDIVLETVNSMTAEKKLIPAMFGQSDCVSLPDYYAAEKYIAEKLRLLSFAEPLYKLEGVTEQISLLEEKFNIAYDEEQKRAIRLCVTGGVTVITGGPGTGKTTIIKAIIDMLDSLKLSFSLAAPTGRAAKRMSEASGKEAKTIHRLLEMNFNGEHNLVFTRNETNPLPAKAVIIDEMSMVDSLLFSSLLHALEDDTYLILIGDVDQLPPVGAGNVLSDIIESNIFDTVRLKKIFRQANLSLIIRNAHMINNGEMPRLDVRDSDFFYMGISSPRALPDKLVSLVSQRLPAAYGYNPIEDIQVLTPTRKGMTGTRELNAVLQAALNPPERGKHEKKYGMTIFREGDKIMQLKNNYDIVWSRDGNEGTGVFNGDIGKIVAINNGAGYMAVDFEGRVAEYDYTLLEELELAYAVTVHKAQGSEYPVVILPSFDCPLPLMTRNLLYTAVTRARDMVIIVGKTQPIEIMVKNNRKSERFTLLKKMFADLG